MLAAFFLFFFLNWVNTRQKWHLQDVSIGKPHAHTFSNKQKRQWQIYLKELFFCRIRRTERNLICNQDYSFIIMTVTRPVAWSRFLSLHVFFFSCYIRIFVTLEWYSNLFRYFFLFKKMTNFIYIFNDIHLVTVTTKGMS
jgi:hypothetical protein